MYTRLFAIQGAWNYETLMGNGIAFALEPALRRLPGGRIGSAYRSALARESEYFNAHPYIAALAVGGLARAELDGQSAERILRFRTACCGPLGSVGDRLVWTGWLPLSSLIALFLFGLGVHALIVVMSFLAFYNVGHFALRAWCLRAGWREGLRIAQVLAHPVFRQGPRVLASATAIVAGAAVPLTVARIIGPRPLVLSGLLVLAVAWSVISAALARRPDGWRAALVGATVYSLLSLRL
jgi:mannose/fructose/N-acetylgalactosamine-specific phosphotransferase system component IID